MNKEEIEKLLKINETIITSEQCKEHRTLKNDERVLLINNIKIKDYIQELEFQNTALKAEHNHNITRIKELEQKESMLDKVTDKLKEDILKTKEEIKYWEKRYRNAKESNKKSFYRQINRCQSKFETLREILKIIEGGKE